MKTRITWLMVSLILVLVVVLASCGPAPTSTPTTTPTIVPTTAPTTAPPTTPGKEMVRDVLGRLVEKPQYGGTFRPLTWGGVPPASFDPSDANPDSNYAFGFMYERLGIGDWAKGGSGTDETRFGHNTYFDIDKFGKGHLAESWEMPDSVTLVIHVRKGIHFQNIPPVNGRELTAEDVRYSEQRFCDNPVSPCAWRPYVQSITAPDKWTVVFKWKQPYGSAVLDIMFTPWIYAPESVTAYGNLRDWRNACGTGPFILKDYVPDSSLYYVKNTNYWCYDEIIPQNRLPYVDAVKAMIIKDGATQLAALRTGKIDVLLGVLREQQESLQVTNPELKSYKTPRWNAAPLVLMRTDEPPFNDVRVRRAMNMAIDFNAIMRDYFKGQSVLINFPIMPDWGDMYTPVQQMPAGVQENYSYNPQKAKQILKEAGYPDGFTVDFTVFPTMGDRCLVLSEYWKAIGVKCNMSTPDQATAMATLFGKKYHGIGSITAGVSGPTTCLAWFQTNAFYNVGLYSNPEYDALMNKLLTTTDAKAQVSLVKEATTKLFMDMAFIQFPAESWYIYWQPWVKQYQGEVSIGGGMGAAVTQCRVWIDQNLKEKMGR